MNFRRVFLIVLDGVGAGALPDARDFGDEGSDTLGHALPERGLEVPHLASRGLSALLSPPGPPVDVDGAWGRLVERSPGKDTTTGHWELAGLTLDRPFPVYPEGFPAEVMEPFEKAVGRKALWNRPASGTEIIARLGAEHVRTGRPIVYTSADSVFQVACHEDVVPVEDLYRMCETARALLAGPHAVSRVIARPFEGRTGAYRRTARRKDFSLAPPADTLLDRLVAADLEVRGIGKIEDIFAFRGLTASEHTPDNASSTEALVREAADDFTGLCMANLIDFDMLYGHRRDAEGFLKALEAFDEALPRLERALKEGDLLAITADHGNDPRHPGTDHTREYVPLLVWRPGVRGETRLGDRNMADLGATIAENFDVVTESGSSFLEALP